MSALTAEQLQAVERRRGPLALSAAAGSGKTSVLVERFVAAVREDGLAPAQILAITFTDRAAAELRERVRARFLELGARAAARDTEAAFVSTFHGFCARLLRTHALQAGVDPDFEILDEGLAAGLRLRCFARALGEFVAAGGDAVDLAAAYLPDRLRAMIEGAYHALRSRGEMRPRLPLPAAGPPQALRAGAELGRLLTEFGAAYEQAKRRRGALDFDDLELRARELLQRDAGVRARLAERFELVMVDEFQDTNRRQLDILSALQRENLFTVGDALQAIYGFRHADVSLFRARSEQLQSSGALLELTRNFRSLPEVLDAVAAVFGARLPAFSTPLSARAEQHEQGNGASAGGTARAPAAGRVELLITDKCDWSASPELVREIAAGLPRAPLWRQAEARALARAVSELIAEERLRAGEVAVLLRALGDIHVYERALQLDGLRTIAAAGAFWEQQPIEDLIAYARALANPLDELAFYGALASPLAADAAPAARGASRGGLSKDALALLARAAREQHTGAYETGLDEARLNELPAAERLAIHRFCLRLQQERRELPRRSLSELLERVLERSGYRRQLIAAGSGERGIANLSKLLRLARRFEAREGRDLRAFLEHVAQLKRSARGGESEAPVEGVEPDAVRLMSIHAAKGLEFPVVCIADLGRAPNTRVPDLLLDGQRIGLNLASLDGEGAVPVLDYEALRAERAQQEAEEEDRIIYVAMTRARDVLLLSGAIELERWPEDRHSACALGWIGPALREDLPALALAARQQGRSELQLEVGERRTPVRVLLVHPHSAELLRAPERERAGGAEPSAAAAVGEQLALALAPAAAPRQASESAPPEQPPEPPARAAEPQPFELPAALSFSSLSQLERCGYRYYLERVLGLPEQDDQHAQPAAARAPGAEPASLACRGTAAGARERGTLVHRLLEQLDFARAQAPDAGAVAHTAAQLGLALSHGEALELVALIGAALRAQPARRAAAARSLHREQPFAFSLARRGTAAGAAQPLLSGVIDLLAIEPDGGALVLDYKSNALAPGEDLHALVARDYALQRELYALAVLLTGAPSVEVVHWFLERPEEHVATHYAARQRGSLQSSLEARLHSARASGYAVSPRPHRGLCASCPGRAALCSWGPEQTLRELPPAA